MDEKYLLIRAHYDKRVASMEPLGAEYLLACLKAEGREGMILDEGLYSAFGRFERIKKQIERNNITFVGLSCMSNTTWYDLEIAHRIKTLFPNIKIMVGGPEVVINHKDFMLDDIDYIYYDNGLDSFRLAVRNDFSPEILKDCTGLAYRSDGEWVDNPPCPPIKDYGIFPDRTIFYENRKKYRVLAKGTFSLLKTSFSCPQKCNFCVSRHFNSCSYQERPLESVMRELQELKNDKIFIVDDDFLVNKERVVEICQRLLELQIRKTFMIFARADSICKCEDIMPLLYKAGFRDMLVGLEAVEDTTLEKYNKNSSVELNKKAVALLRNHKMVCVGLFVINYDFTHRDFMKINHFIRQEKLIWVLFSILIPFKGTPVYEENKDRLYRYQYKRTDGTHVLMHPKHLPKWLFKLEYDFLYYVNYPRIYWAGIRGTFNKEYKNQE